MARKNKTVINNQGLDRRELGYYSTPQFVGSWLCRTLRQINPQGRSALDPCIGKGELTQGLLQQRDIAITGFDIEAHQLPAKIKFQQLDFLEFFCAQQAQKSNGTNFALDYDFYLANPPYNCHEVDYLKQRKQRFSAVFNNIGVLNTYSLFIYALIELAKDGALIGLVTLDSFLTSNFHKSLREKILRDCTIHHLLLCPTDLFAQQKADVRTCIMVLQKGRQFQQGIKTLNRPLDSGSFMLALEKDEFAESSREQLFLTTTCDRLEFTVGVPKSVTQLFAEQRLGQVFPCITGISTGADKRYLKAKPQQGFSIPFYKNPGGRRFHAEPDGYLVDNYLEVGQRVKNFSIRNKQYLGRSGISCSSMGVSFGAAYRPGCSVFGVNANIILDDQNAWWLLGYLNSSLVTFIVRGVLNRSNMLTPGYVARIPLPEFSSQLKTKFAKISSQAYQEKVAQLLAADAIARIDAEIFAALGFSPSDSQLIHHFSQNVVKAA